jgi:hypothetical protein
MWRSVPASRPAIWREDSAFSRSPSQSSSGWHTLGVAALALAIGLGIRFAPDVWRYMKIRSM